MNIPKVMCHIWVGPKAPPLKWMRTWQEKHPEWQYEIFDNQKLKTTSFRNQHLIDEYMSRRKYAGVADLIRYEWLLLHGGFMPPADAVCLNPVDGLFTEDVEHCYTVYENESLRPRLVSPIYACNPGNAFVGLLVDTLNKLTAAQLIEPWRCTGNLFVADMIEKHKPKIKIFPSHYFIPKHYDPKHTRYAGTDIVYADQMWGSTLNRY